MRTWTEEERRQQGDKMRAMWADPAYAERQRQRCKDLCDMMATDPRIVAKQRANHKAAMTRLLADPAHRARMGFLPPMSPDDRRVYNNLRRLGVERNEALKVLKVA